MSCTITDFLRDLEDSAFYGSVELKFEHGRLTVARKSETIKLESQKYSRDNRGNHVEHQQR